jgi:hypothetical protein
MSLLEPFSKPRWQHRDPAVRLAAVEELDDETVLLEVLEADEDAAVRARALARVGNAATLDRLIAEKPPWLTAELLRQARAQRLSQLLPDAGGLSAADDATLLRITALTEDGDLLESTIGHIQNVQLRADLAVSHPLARARLCAARSIVDIEALQTLMQQARNKDKAVFRHCRERLDEHQATQREEEDRARDLARLAEDAASLRAAADAPDYRGRFLGLQQRWAGLREHASAEQQTRIQTDLDGCAARIEKLSAARADEEAQRARAAEAEQAFPALLAELAELQPTGLASDDAAAAIEACLNSVEERWVATLRLARPAPEQTETCKAQLAQWRAALQIGRRVHARRGELERLFEAAGHVDPADYRAIQKLQQQAAKLTRALPWPEALSAGTPPAIARLHEQQPLLEQRLLKLADKEEKTLEKVQAAFETLRTELETNHFRNADRALSRLRSLLRQLSPARQDHFQQELRPLLARLQEIHDWQGFAIEPKKQELVEAMKALAGDGTADEKVDVDVLAAKIKALQKEWKKLGPLAPRADQALWKAFSSAADEAWAPCKEAFEERAGLRQQLYRQRMDLVAQLVDYEKKIAWPDLDAPDKESPPPDWSMVRKTLNTARKAFGEIGPVDRKQERKSRKALDKVCGRIFAHLEKEYASNIERKKALVEEARALVALDDLKQSIERAKAIQREWKDAGLTPQRFDRALWKDFRAACDAVFARLGEEREQRDAGARERAVQRQVQERARGEQAAERKRLEQERWQRLLERMQACGLKATDPEQATAVWGEDEEVAKGIDGAALQAWWQDGPDEGDADTLREACIALEVLAGIESPPEEKQARMAYQMKRLVEGMGSGPGDSRERLLEAINRFIALRPPGEWVGRFCRGLETALGMENKS